VTALLLAVPACGPDVETYEIRAYGEAFVEDEIPASEVSDGWAIEFDEFVVAIGELTVKSDDRVDLEGWYVLDLTEPTDGAGQLLTEVELAGMMTSVEYRLGRVRGEVVGGNASPAQVDALVRGGHGLSVRGRARRGDEEVTFAWDFPMDYGHTCPLGQDLATPRPGGPTLTIHADHLLLDDLEHEPRIAFDTIAQADADADGVVTGGELSLVDITILERYQSGSAEIHDLWSYIGRLAGTLGHIDGEGGCMPMYVPRDYVGLATPGEHGAGADVYMAHCASCHGETGEGDGPAAMGWPRPTNLTRLGPAALDPDYLLYRIREGGDFFPYNSTMTAYEGVLSEGQEQALLGRILGWNHGSGQ
jgi:hypothetical protein